LVGTQIGEGYESGQGEDSHRDQYCAAKLETDRAQYSCYGECSYACGGASPPAPLAPLALCTDQQPTERDPEP
jgi:hypothetical protein